VIGCKASFGLDADEKWRTATGGDAFAWEVLGLKCQRKGTFLKILKF
jgi:hypothetical protein